MGAACCARMRDWCSGAPNDNDTTCGGSICNECPGCKITYRQSLCSAFAAPHTKPGDTCPSDWWRLLWGFTAVVSILFYFMVWAARLHGHVIPSFDDHPTITWAFAAWGVNYFWVFSFLDTLRTKCYGWMFLLGWTCLQTGLLLQVIAEATMRTTLIVSADVTEYPLTSSGLVYYTVGTWIAYGSIAYLILMFFVWYWGILTDPDAIFRDTSNVPSGANANPPTITVVNSNPASTTTAGSSTSRPTGFGQPRSFG